MHAPYEDWYLFCLDDLEEWHVLHAPSRIRTGVYMLSTHYTSFEEANIVD